MLNNNATVPANETDRLMALYGLDLDYSAIESYFRDLTGLAARITGAPVSLINLIDSYTQWSIAKHGMPLHSMPRKDSVCQYTIMEGNDHFEVKDLSADDRFKDKFYVTRPDGFRYYFGVPLRDANGLNIGALCILNTEKKELSAEEIEQLKLIAGEIVNRLEYLREMHELSNSLTALQTEHRALAADINDPLSGIAGILDVILDTAGEIRLEEVIEYVRLMKGSSDAILSLTKKVLDNEEGRPDLEGDGDLVWLKAALERLYGPICRESNIAFHISTSARTERVSFPKNKVLLVAGNLVAYAIGQTSAPNAIDVALALKVQADSHLLVLEVCYPDEKQVLNKTQNNPLKLIESLVTELGGRMDTRHTSPSTTSLTVNIRQPL
ncbi:MAG: GAF domain-containing protein [Mucilaginibacter sp.]